jgi:23S rRNA G2069 N7-methylase RlmK/C1962 C5-methylase RlmI
MTTSLKSRNLQKILQITSSEKLIRQIVYKSPFSTYLLLEHPNGKLDKKDFRKMISEALPKKDVSKMEKHVFRVYDTNGDGYIDFVEFMVVFHILSGNSKFIPVKEIIYLFECFNLISVICIGPNITGNDIAI